MKRKLFGFVGALMVLFALVALAGCGMGDGNNDKVTDWSEPSIWFYVSGSLEYSEEKGITTASLGTDGSDTGDGGKQITIMIGHQGFYKEGAADFKYKVTCTDASGTPVTVDDDRPPYFTVQTTGTYTVKIVGYKTRHKGSGPGSVDEKGEEVTVTKSITITS